MESSRKSTPQLWPRRHLSAFRAELFKVFDSRYEATFAGYLFQDADTIPIYGALSEKRREGFGWTARVDIVIWMPHRWIVR